MATANEPVTDAKADAAAEKGYAAAASTKPTARIDAALAEVKAAPKKAAARKPKASAARKPRAAKAPARKIIEASAPKPVSPVSKLEDKFMAKTQTTDFSQGFQAAAADAQTRAKAAYDTFQGYAGEMTELTKGNVEALVESGRILGAGMQDIARTEVEAAKDAFATVTADLKAMAAVKSPTELFQLQGEIVRRNFDAAVARASKSAEVSLKLAGDAFAPISNRMSIAAEKVSKAA